MAKCFSVASVPKVALYLFLLTISLRCVSSARILNEAEEIVDTPTSPLDDVEPTISPAAVEATGVVANDDHTHPPLTFFMHDIVSGSTPSTGTVARNVANSGGVFPVNSRVPLLNGNTGITNNKNVPLVTGLGNTNTFVTGGQVPVGSTLQQPIFGSITVIDDELTQGHELGSSVVGKVQGFSLASSQDGSSQTMALTALLHGTGAESDHDFDTISLFGIHQTAAPLSHIAVIGGTGKYENSKGYATIESLHEVDQHATEGVETVLKISVYLTP